MSGLFLSDLHLFSRRSVGQSHWDEHRSAIADSSTIVLGGDIFDIRWSQLGSLRSTLSAAERWLEDAIRLNPSASWVYLLGNHDCHPAIQDLLRTIADRHPGFVWSPSVWRVGSNLFLHGDILDGHSHAGGLDAYRSSFHEDHPRGPVGNMLYSAVIQSRLHGVVPRLRHSPAKSCRQLLKYLRTECADFLPEIHRIYFGHTHVPLSDFEYAGYTFHNAGSGIRHLKFAPAVFETDEQPSTLIQSEHLP